jgi:hypothetical protein
MIRGKKKYSQETKQASEPYPPTISDSQKAEIKRVTV